MGGYFSPRYIPMPDGIPAETPRRPLPFAPEPAAEVVASESDVYAFPDLAADISRGVGSAAMGVGRWAARHSPFAQMLEEPAVAAPPPPVVPGPIRTQQAPWPGSQRPGLPDPYSTALAGSPPEAANVIDPDPDGSLRRAYDAREAGDAQARAGVASRAFRPTEDPWGNAGYMSQGQIEQDEIARGGINSRHQARLDEIAASEVANDPMLRSLEARRKTLGYEGLMTAPPRMAAAEVEGTDLQLVRQRHTPGTTNASRRAIEEAMAKNYDPKAMLDIESAAKRQEVVAALQEQNAKLKHAIKTGKMTAADGLEQLKYAVLQAAETGALLDGDYRALVGLLFPKIDPDAALMADLGQRKAGRQ